MSESPLYGSIMLRASSSGLARIFRNNVGLFYTKDGRPVRCGLAVGSSDLIGVTSRVVTLDMVGQTVGLFTALECKTAKGAKREEQEAFIAMVRRRGGIAARVTSVEEALRVMEIDR